MSLAEKHQRWFYGSLPFIWIIAINAALENVPAAAMYTSGLMLDFDVLEMCQHGGKCFALIVLASFKKDFKDLDTRELQSRV